MPATLDTFQGSLPPFRAVLVPLWAMAPQSVPEAFSQDFLFPPPPLRWIKFSLRDSFSLFNLVQLLSSAAGWKTFDRVRSAAGVEWPALGFGGDGKGAHVDAASFPNNCNPPPGPRRRLTTCSFSPKVIIQLKTPGTPLVLPGTHVGHSGFGFDKQAEERSAVHTSDPLMGLRLGLIPLGGVTQSPCCLCNRRGTQTSLRAPLLFPPGQTGRTSLLLTSFGMCVCVSVMRARTVVP